MNASQHAASYLLEKPWEIQVVCQSAPDHLPGASEVEKVLDTAKRQRIYVKGGTSFRPRKMHRATTAKCGAALCNQVACLNNQSLPHKCSLKNLRGLIFQLSV